MPRRATREFNAEAFLQKAVADHAPERLKNKQVIFSQGQPADAAFHIQSGRVRISAISNHGKEATLALMGEKDFVGEECVASSDTLRLTTATAISDVAMIRIQKSTMVSLLKTQHRFLKCLWLFFFPAMPATRKALADQLFNSSEKRLARVLLQLAKYGTDGVAEPVVPKMTHEMLAEMVGTTRARISFFMNRFPKIGFIHYNGVLEVHSSLLNVLLHDWNQKRDAAVDGISLEYRAA
jgi:CRP/FNR family cyclic AMP-dependent transcriptional regulator